MMPNDTPSSDVVLRNGSAVTAGGVIANADVHITDGRIAAIGVGLDVDAVEIDCSGAWVGPGFVDIHTHLREPGQEWKEDIASGSHAAAAGGYTAVVAMPNTAPAIDAGHLALLVAHRGMTVGLVDVIPSGCITMGRSGEKLSHLDELWDAGVRMFTDDGDTVGDAGLLRRAMEYLAQRDGVIAQHCIDPGLARGGQMHEGEISARLGMAGIPAEAEETIIARDLALVRLTGARYHVQHLSTAGAVDLVAAAKAEGLPVTAEVTPHHLLFDHRRVEATDPVFKMMPPLRTPRDVDALRRALQARIIDAVATDHAPHAAHEKDVPWEEAPFGVTGLEWAAAVTNTVAGLSAADFFDAMSTAPARIAGLHDHGGLAVGSPANVVVFDPDRPAQTTMSYSKSPNSPYLGADLDLRGSVRLTIYRGTITCRNGQVADLVGAP